MHKHKPDLQCSARLRVQKRKSWRGTSNGDGHETPGANAWACLSHSICAVADFIRVRANSHSTNKENHNRSYGAFKMMTFVAAVQMLFLVDIEDDNQSAVPPWSDTTLLDGMGARRSRLSSSRSTLYFSQRAVKIGREIRMGGRRDNVRRPVGLPFSKE